MTRVRGGHTTVAIVDTSGDDLACVWARAVVDSGCVMLTHAEVERLTRDWLYDLGPLLTGASTDLDPARAVGADLVRAYLTDPAALEATLVVLDTHLVPGPRAGAVLGAIAAGYADELRQTTFVEQEQMIRAIIVTYAGVDLAARRHEARFQALFAGAPLGIAISDHNGQIIQANQALADMLRYTVDELCSLNLLDLLRPSDPAELQRVYDQMRRGAIDRIRLERSCRRKDGDDVWVDLTASVIVDDAGQPQFGVAIMDDVTERHVFQSRLHHQALHDPLTGLPNRSMLVDRISDLIDAADGRARIGLCYLDLDGFKRINDTLGHDIGDQLLVSIGQRLGACANHRGCLAARMGGDEFVLLVEASAGADQLAAVADAAAAAVAVPITVGPHRLRVTASIGVVERRARGSDPADILKAADVTLYRAKAAGRGRWLMYDPDIVAAQVASYELCAQMPDALERGEFSLVYQPIVDLPDGSPEGFEALVRWHHPHLGLLGPDRFIGPAEETGFIVHLGRYVLRQACQEAATWPDRFPGEDWFVSVNLAAAQAHEPSLVEEVEQVLAETGLKACRLQLELTESALMRPSGAPLEALTTLAQLGVRVAIDDFGTGYSNLAYLRSLPVHSLKLPHELVAGLSGAEAWPEGPSDRPPERGSEIDDRIVDALIRLAHAIDLVVVAEGVETPRQAEQLCSLGCDSAQGWHFAKPCAPDQLGVVLRGLRGAPRVLTPRTTSG